MWQGLQLTLGPSFLCVSVNLKLAVAKGESYDTAANTSEKPCNGEGNARAISYSSGSHLGKLGFNSH